VVHPGPALREETADGGVLAESAQKLEPAFADADGRGLDSLLLDARATLEPGAEETPVGVERAVEILDRQTDVMYRARRLHVAMVFERLAATMRALALALVLTAVLLAGCGGSGKSAKPNDEASKPAAQVLADANKAATSASSAHVSGSIKSDGTPITLDLSTARGKGAKGSMSTNGLKFDVVRIGDTLYIRGSDSFLKRFAGGAVAQLLHDKWLKASATHGRLKSLAPLTSLGALFAGISAHHGKLVNEGKTTYKGDDAVVVRDTSDNSKLYVSATGKPYPVAIVGGKKGESGTITFDDWNKNVSLSAPSGALDISQFGG
jgi:outer membrane lipoprotein-sorting protein